MATEEIPCVTKKDVEECEFSAQFWASELGVFAERMRGRSRLLSILSGGLSALAGLGVWSTLSASSDWLAVFLVSLVSFLTTFLVIIQQTMKYGECAGAAENLPSLYANALGDLRAALTKFHEGELESDDPLAIKAVSNFHEVKRLKGKLNPFPADLQKKINDLRNQKKINDLGNKNK
jgi:hypothetical protein